MALDGIKFSKEDYDKWTEFLSVKSDRISGKEFEMICELHAEYFKHKFYKPCTCSPKTIKRWINDLTNIYDQS